MLDHFSSLGSVCSTWVKVFGRLRFTRSSRIKKLLGTVNEFWRRESSDDLLYIFLVLIDSFVVEVRTASLSSAGRHSKYAYHQPGGIQNMLAQRLNPPPPSQSPT